MHDSIQPKTPLILPQVTIRLQIDIILQAHHLLGCNPAFGLLAVGILVADEHAFVAVDRLTQFGRQFDAFAGPGGRVVNTDLLVERLVEYLHLLHHRKEYPAHRQRAVICAVLHRHRQVE